VFHRYPAIVLFALCAGAPVMAQLMPQFNCMVTLESPTTVRAEGVTEQLNDLVITCTGGQPTPSGLPVPTSNFQLLLNGNVSNPNITNRLDASPYVDAFLMIDEPHSVANPNVPLLACTDTCTILGSHP